MSKTTPADSLAAITRFQVAAREAHRTAYAAGKFAPRDVAAMTKPEKKRLAEFSAVGEAAMKEMRDGVPNDKRQAQLFINPIAQDRESALKELRDATPDVMKLFAARKIDASAVYQFLLDIPILRQRSHWETIPAEACLYNLRLQIHGASMADPDYLTTTELAGDRKVGVDAVVKWCEKNEGPGKCEKIDGRWRINRAFAPNYRPGKRKKLLASGKTDRLLKWDCCSCAETLQTNRKPTFCPRCGKNTEFVLQPERKAARPRTH